jgi:hypothetical protein
MKSRVAWFLLDWLVVFLLNEWRVGRRRYRAVSR